MYLSTYLCPSLHFSLSTPLYLFLSARLYIYLYLSIFTRAHFRSFTFWRLLSPFEYWGHCKHLASCSKCMHQKVHIFLGRKPRHAIGSPMTKSSRKQISKTLVVSRGSRGAYDSSTRILILVYATEGTCNTQLIYLRFRDLMEFFCRFNVWYHLVNTYDSKSWEANGHKKSELHYIETADAPAPFLFFSFIFGGGGGGGGASTHTANFGPTHPIWKVMGNNLNDNIIRCVVT